MVGEWAAALAFASALLPGLACAQGTDGKPAERDLMVIAEMLPGRWDNGEQALFEPRMKVPVGQRHAQEIVTIERKEVALNRAVLVARKGGDETTLTLIPVDATTVRMDVAKGCAILWRREAGQFRGIAEAGCQQPTARMEWQLASDRLWIGEAGTVPAKYLRATLYHCYVDMPGASGGRAVPFKRIDGLDLWDTGEITWFDSPETPSRRLGLQLRNVQWQINNAPGVFARDSLTMYLVEKSPDGGEKSLLYAWTSKGAARVGVNGIWALANCAREALKDAKPEF
jgi:hypothetical protein